VSGLDDRFPVTDAIYGSVLPGDRLEAAAREGRLYLADYRDLQDVQEGFFRSAPKFLSAPLGLFAVEKSSGELVAVAIQCEQKPGPDNPIFTPHDGNACLSRRRSSRSPTRTCTRPSAISGARTCSWSPS